MDSNLAFLPLRYVTFVQVMNPQSVDFIINSYIMMIPILFVLKTPAKDSGTTKTFGMSSSGFSFTPTSTPAKHDKAKSPLSPEGDYYVNSEEDDSNIYFEPIVQLPEKVNNRWH